jgi:hypothetical protein
MVKKNIIKQLSIFVNNEPGSLASIALVLKECGINLKAFNIAESSGFGVLRAIADDPEGACRVLRERNIVVKQTDVIAVSVEDQPGGLFRIANIMGDAKINIEYAYAYTGRNGPSIFLRVDDPEAAAAAVKRAGMVCLSQKDI